MADDQALDDQVKKQEEYLENVRLKEQKVKIEFERQMDDLKQNAKLIADTNTRQLNEIE